MNPLSPARAARFITLEGIEGAGKSTAAPKLAAWLQQRGISVDVTREPGGTPLAEKLRGLLLERDSEGITPATETLLMFAARAAHVANRIRPQLAAGRWVLCDRFTDATRAYQGAGRGQDRAWIDQLEAQLLDGLKPDRTLLFDLPVAEGLARAQRRAGDTDRFESERHEFFERARAEYLAIARREPQRVRVLDARLPPEALLQAAQRALEDLL
ncbi:MAG: dTMP kinase [Steroidobacteraceae bacterium]